MNPINLSGKVKRIIHHTAGYDEPLLSAISPWEFSKLLEKKRKVKFARHLFCFLDRQVK